MAVLVEAISVILKTKAVEEKYEGGWDAFLDDVPNCTYCTDGELVRIGFMTPVDVEFYIASLEANGLTFHGEQGAVDMVVADQQEGFTVPCDWCEFGHAFFSPDAGVSACKLVGSACDKLSVPDDWAYEDSLSSDFVFQATSDKPSRMQLVGHEASMDFYVDRETGEEFYSARVSPQTCGIIYGCSECQSDLYYGKEITKERVSCACGTPKNIMVIFKAGEEIPIEVAECLCQLTVPVTVLGMQYLQQISALSMFTRIDSLKLIYCYSLTDLTPLSSLTKLKSLTIGECPKVTDLSPLTSMTGLEELTLHTCQSIKDLSPVAHLPALRKLELVNETALTDISVLPQCANLEELSLEGSVNIASVDPLADCKKLKHIIHIDSSTSK